MWSKSTKSCRFSFAMLTNFENCCFASFENPSEIWSVEERLSSKCLYHISLTSGLSTNRFGIKHLKSRVRENFLGDLPVIWEHNVDRKLTTSLLNPKNWLVLTFPFFWNWLKGELHSNYIFLYFALIGLEWDSITLFTKMNPFFPQNSHFNTICTRYIWPFIYQHKHNLMTSKVWAETF